MISFLKGKNIYLRPVEEDDLEGDYLKWINDSINDQFTEHAQFPHRAENLKSYARNKWNDSSCVWLAIAEIVSDKHIGNIELCNIDLVHRKAEFKILIDKDSQGKGYGSQASELILSYAFGKLNLHKIYLGVHEDNQKAKRLYERLGFIQEGVLRETFLRDGSRKNTIVMGLLASEFKK